MPRLQLSDVRHNPRAHLGSRGQFTELLVHWLDCAVGRREPAPDDPFAAQFDVYRRPVSLRGLHRYDGTRLRVRDCRFSVQSMIGHVSVLQAQNVIGATFHSHREQLHQHQQNADWCPVAYRVTSTFSKKSARHRNTEASADYSPSALYAPDPRTNLANVLSTTEHEVLEECLRVHVAWFDFLDAEEVDYLLHERGTPSTISNLAAGKPNLRQRNELGLAKDIILDTLLEDLLEDTGDPEAVARLLSEDGTSITAEEIIDRLGLAPEPIAEAPRVQDQLSPAQVAVAAKLRSQGTSYRDLGAILGIPWTAVRDALGEVGGTGE